MVMAENGGDVTPQEVWDEAQSSLMQAEGCMANHGPGHESYALERLLHAIALCQLDAMANRYHGAKGLLWGGEKGTGT